MPYFTTNLLTRDPEWSAKFYNRLAGFEETDRGDTFILMATPEGSRLALIDWVSQLVPRAARGIVEGTYLTVVVDDVDAALEVAREFGVEIVERSPGENGASPHAVIRDLDGRVIEVSTPAALFVVPPEKTVA